MIAIARRLVADLGGQDARLIEPCAERAAARWAELQASDGAPNAHGRYA